MPLTYNNCGSLFLFHFPFPFPIASGQRDQENKEKTEDLELPLFDLATISSATDDFSTNNKLGEGGFGPVYKVICNFCFSAMTITNE